MPFGNDNNFKISEYQGNSAYTKIFSIFNRSADRTTLGRQNKATISLQSEPGYSATLRNLSSGLWNSVAGSDLSNIFYPYLARTGAGGSGMPALHSGVAPSSQYSLHNASIYRLMPFEFKNENTTVLYDRAFVPSGDSIRSVLSGDVFLGNVDTFRSIDSIRSIGQRLPAVGVGWGLDCYGYPFPSGDTINANAGAYAIETFQNPSGNGIENVVEGWQIDPTNYIAAPIDMRYDPRNATWGPPKPFWAEVSGGIASGTRAGYHAWREVVWGLSGVRTYGHRFGTHDRNPAIEVNYTVTSGVVLIQPKDHRHFHLFTTGGGGSGNVALDIPNPSEAGQVLLSISSNQFRWLAPVTLG